MSRFSNDPSDNRENRKNPLDSDFASYLRQSHGEGESALNGFNIGQYASRVIKPIPPYVEIDEEGLEWETVVPGPEQLPGEPRDHSARMFGPNSEEIYIP